MRKLGHRGNCIYSVYYGCSELVVGIASMGKLPNLDAFDQKQIVGARSMGHSISVIVGQLALSSSTVSSVCQEHMDGEQNTVDRENCKLQLSFTVCGKRRLRRIVHSKRNQKLAQTNTKMKDDGSYTVRKWIAQHSLHRMAFGSHRPTRVPMLNTRHRAVYLDWVREHRDWSVDTRFRILNANGRLRMPRLQSYRASLRCFETRHERPSHTPTNFTKLWTALANIWQIIPVEQFQKLVESMPHRVAAVVKARAGPTRYSIVSNMLRSRQQHAFAMETYFTNARSVIAVQHAFRCHFDIPPRGHVPHRKCDLMWVYALRAMGNVSKKKRKKATSEGS
ncbi:HTH_Tnp_Tc3_2 domain-containing protein [Trichonephila clavipes]|nr:HTH_Tnp_Tc3_2 domain-containing protein [Trichonephila clavipes]